MSEPICDTIETLLASVQEEIDDPKLSYKLRTARQLNVASNDRIQTVNETLEEVDLNPEVVNRLEELGYL